MFSALELFWLKRKKPKGWIEGFSETNSLFIHIPKTAGTSIAKAVYGEDPWHYTLGEYSYVSQKTLKQLYKFAIVRNPYDRLASTYKYSFKQVRSHPNTSVKFITNYPSFEDFVIDWVNKKNVRSHYFLYPQCMYLGEEREKIKMDFIGKFEDLANAYEVIAKKLDIKSELPVTNKSQNTIDARYTDKTAEIVYDAYQEDFTKLSYSKDSFRK